MTAETILWIFWIAQFLAIEGPALIRNNYRGTLTAHLRALLAGFLVWLFLHLMMPPGMF